MTDIYGNINNISEGLGIECGLNAKFFNKDILNPFKLKVNINLLFPNNFGVNVAEGID